MSDTRNEYGTPDPWEQFGDGEVPLTPEHLYCGPHETITNLVLLHETIIDFEIWVGEFRAEDVLKSRFPMSRWEQDSPFSELKSIELSMAPKLEG